MAKSKKILIYYASLWNIFDFKPEFEEFLNFIDFELRKIESSGLLHIKAQISNFLKLTTFIVQSKFEGDLKNAHFSLFQWLSHCANLEIECSNLWENVPKPHIYITRKNIHLYFIFIYSF